MCDLAEEYGALTFIDECHATGFLGATGRYTCPVLNFLKFQLFDLLKMMVVVTAVYFLSSLGQ